MLTINQSIKGIKVDFFKIQNDFLDISVMIHFWSAQKKKFTKDLPVKLSTIFQFQLEHSIVGNPQRIMLWLFFIDKWRKIGVWSAVGYQGYGLSAKDWNETSSEHKLCQTWNTCLVSCIYWSMASLSKLLISF